MDTRRFLAFAAGAAFVAGFMTAQAQEPAPQDVVRRVEHFEIRGPAPADARMREETFAFIAAEGGAPGKVVKGAPYSAELVTESVQTLTDGNRITHRSASSVARDTEGRTRREQTFPAIGPWASEGDAPKLVFIHDPVANAGWIVDEKAKTVRKTMVRTGGVRDVTKIAPEGVRTMSAGPGHMEVQVIRREGGPAPAIARLQGEPKGESLGQRNIEGVVADGTRTVLTIPAGAAGNERPIEVVTERWYSPELQTTVLSKHTDPRFGETTFKLTKVSRANPPKTMFEPPADYQVLEGGPGPVEIRVRKEK